MYVLWSHRLGKSTIQKYPRGWEGPKSVTKIKIMDSFSIINVPS